MKISHLVINGLRDNGVMAADSIPENFDLKAAFTIDRSFRSSSEKQKIDITADDVIELEFEDQTTWICEPGQLGEIFPETLTKNRSGDGGIEIPASISSDTVHRGAGEILLKVVRVFARKKIAQQVKKIAEDFERKRLKNKSGLYKLDTKFDLLPFNITGNETKFCIFIHGTASSTEGSFKGITGHALWKLIQEEFGSNILAFEHETLTKSPLQNALDLIKALPDYAEVTLITHSRGGLVGDIIARYATDNENARGFSEEEIAVFQKAKRNDEIDLIKDLNQAIAGKRIRIMNYLRIACPAAGTTLASGRLDRTLNMLLNLIGMATGISSVIFSSFKALVSEVVKSKTNPEVLPGLEAMDPESPFIKALNFVASPIEVNSPLVVISGNCRMKVNLKALLILASKFFYRRSNDLIVDTASMYLGARRAQSIQYFFEEEVETNHFNYFLNSSSLNALANALKWDGQSSLPEFQSRTQLALSEQQRNALLGLEGGEVYKHDVSGNRPIVVLLPGIMGSTLHQNGNKVWINYLRFALGELKRLDLKSKEVKAKGLVATSYSALVKYLEKHYDVVTFAFDWRLPLEDAAMQLRDKLEELLSYGQPIKLIGHSMGGVLVRDFIARHRDTWNKLNSSNDFTLLFLGSPLGGSYRIPYVLFGFDAIITKLSKLDIIHSKKELLKMFSAFPGMLNLLPISGKHDFSDPALWEEMREASGDNDWPIPPDNALKAFAQYKSVALSSVTPDDFKNAVYIAGQDSSTPCDFRIDESPQGKTLVFLSTREGDQSVTWDSGIPTEMTARKAVYFSNVTHGSLANDPSLFPAIRDILEKKSTHLLSTARPVFRSDQKIFVAPDNNDFDYSPQGLEETLLGLKGTEREEKIEFPLTVIVSNGDLKYASYPVMAGHFLNDAILYAEKAIDQNLEYALSEQHSLGIYPGETGSCKIAISSKPGFKGGVIVGLGPSGELTANTLAESVTNGVIQYLLDVNNDKLSACGITRTSEKIGISSLLIGCGFGGLTVESSTRAIIQGVMNANEKIRRSKNKNYRTVEVIEFIEQYEDKARTCFYVINKISANERMQVNVVPGLDKIKPLLGSRKRLPADEYEEWWQRITVTYQPSEKENCKTGALQFSASTGGAREDFRQVFNASELLESLMEEISAGNMWRPELAKAIFELLIPNDLKIRFNRAYKINWILDKKTAEYPWELLQENTADGKPLCINAGMIRQLKTGDSRSQVTLINSNTALVIGDPQLNGFLAQLPGAKTEAEKVTALLQNEDYQTTSLINSKAAEIIEKLFSRDYKIIHLSGHGLFNITCPSNSGMVIGKNMFLTTSQIAQMANTPELVFVNCCYLGKSDAVAEEYYRSRYKFAANIGTQLIENGVKAAVVAAWEVEDSAAHDFAQIFYQKMFEGVPFGDAVHAARKYVYDHHRKTNTWGAYQCYGDPFYRFRPTSGKIKEYKYSFVVEDEVEVELFNLRNYIQTGNYAHEDILARLKAMEKATEEKGLRTARITELEGLIYADLYEYELALQKMENLLKMEEAKYDVSTIERYFNIRAKSYIMEYLKNDKKQRNYYLRKINDVLGEINLLFYLSPTSERYVLLASTTKRKALLQTDKEKMLGALEEASYYYMKAYSYKPSVNALGNWYQLETILNLAGKHKWNTDIKFNEEVYHLPGREHLETSLKEEIAKIQDNEFDNYWQMAKRINLKMNLFLLKASAEDMSLLKEVLADYKTLWGLAGSRGSKFSEVEHIDIIIHALDTIKTPISKKISKELNILRKDLLSILLR